MPYFLLFCHFPIFCKVSFLVCEISITCPVLWQAVSALLPADGHVRLGVEPLRLLAALADDPLHAPPAAPAHDARALEDQRRRLLVAVAGAERLRRRVGKVFWKKKIFTALHCIDHAQTLEVQIQMFRLKYLFDV